MPLPGEGMATIMKNFDGLYYVVIAKSFYRPEVISGLFSFPLPAIYYAAHFPLYPILIKIFSPFFGYLWSMLSVSLLASVLAAVVFYLFVKEFKYSTSPFWLTMIFLFLPARWFVVRSVGSPEPLFLLLLITSFYFFKKKSYWLAGIFGVLAQLTKPPGILLFVAYAIYLIWENRPLNIVKLIKKAYPLLLIPLTLFCLFIYYRFTYHDFWAYFHSGDNIHLFWPPFQVFNAAARWVGTYWLEEIIYVFLLGILGVVLLFKQKRIDLGIFATVFFFSTLFVAHRDIARYSLPLIPFLIIAFEPFLVKKEFKIAFAVILLPIFLYTINFIAGNTLPIADWAPFL
jgi:4-amino-4-deoxy-L-arabinose transferase-like glycosyltransferase